MSAKWTSDRPDQSGGRRVTGATAAWDRTTRELARKGARVVRACRDTTKVAAAVTDIRRASRTRHPGGGTRPGQRVRCGNLPSGCAWTTRTSTRSSTTTGDGASAPRGGRRVRAPFGTNHLAIRITGLLIVRGAGGRAGGSSGQQRRASNGADPFDDRKPASLRRWRAYGSLSSRTAVCLRVDRPCAAAHVRRSLHTRAIPHDLL